ncbi:DUF1462 family protein [Marinococcus halophilus]|uniref:DUF1462 family protein n=1 Tax=Marinococcus halophilus TaxID=1371 RepID=UPI0009A87980|nr:DUF1462 family protein [Marinococcus halophilus]
MIVIKVYGAEKKCPSCVNLPSSRETAEWLEAAIQRKYPEDTPEVEHIDIEDRSSGEDPVAEKVRQEEYFYPLVTVNGTVVAEGNPRLKVIYKEIDKTKEYRSDTTAK